MIFIQFGIIFAALAVGFGAFGAHGLKSKITPEMLQVFEVGVRYQMYHALGLILLGILLGGHSHLLISAAGVCFVLGILIFSGSLYALSLSGIKAFGAATPIGGVLLLAGWISFGLGLMRS